MTLTLKLIDKATRASSTHNEDRIGHHDHYAWIIDGATDLLETRILPGETDAGWFADTLSSSIQQLVASTSPPSLNELVSNVTIACGAAFNAAALRPITHVHEQPSSAGIIFRTIANSVEFFSLGDCTLLFLSRDGPAQDVINPRACREADPHVVKVIKNLKDESATGSAGAIRTSLIPHLRYMRDHLNQPNGYGVFSINSPPEKFIKRGQVTAKPGDTFCLASDGFMRLVDVFEAYSLSTLNEALKTRSLKALLDELRQLEDNDANCRRFPRAKKSDDASALILEVAEA